MMDTLWSLLVWLRRCGHCKGFGVQSPFAFSFINDVVNEHSPYYAYDTLLKAIPKLKQSDRKLCMLCFRLVNYSRPSYVYCFHVNNSYQEYIRQGCRKAVMLDENDDSEIKEFSHIGMAVMTMNGSYEHFFQSFAESTSASALLMILGINHDARSKSFWKRVVDSTKVGLTFDLYYAGIVMFDKKKYKRNYIVNF